MDKARPKGQKCKTEVQNFAFQCLHLKMYSMLTVHFFQGK